MGEATRNAAKKKENDDEDEENEKDGRGSESSHSSRVSGAGKDQGDDSLPEEPRREEEDDNDVESSEGEKVEGLDAEQLVNVLGRTESSGEQRNRNSPPEFWYNRIHRWTEADYDRVLTAAECDRNTTHVSLDVNGLVNWTAVLRTSEVLSRWPQLKHLDIICPFWEKKSFFAPMVKFTDAVLERASIALTEIGRCIPLCRNLSKVALDASERKEFLDVSTFVALAASSHSLEDLTLDNVCLTPSPELSIPHNHTLRTLTLVRFQTLHASACHLLSHFQELHVLKLVPLCLPTASGMHRFPEAWEPLLRHLPNLQTLEYANPRSSINHASIEHDAVLAAISGALRHHPTALRLLRLEVDGSKNPLTQLAALLQSCQGTLHLCLKYPTEFSIAALARGIENAHPDLRELYLSPHHFSPQIVQLGELIALFRALQSNASLQHFELESRIAFDRTESQLTHVEDALTALLATNATLTKLRLRLGSNPRESDPKHRLLRALIEGLDANRSLVELQFQLSEPVSADASARLLETLDRNTSLHRLEGVQLKHDADRREMERFLSLNRRGRYLLFDAEIAERHRGSGGAVPLGLWPLVLAPLAADSQAASADWLFYFLRRLPHAALLRVTARSCPLPADNGA